MVAAEADIRTQHTAANSHADASWNAGGAHHEREALHLVVVDDRSVDPSGGKLAEVDGFGCRRLEDDDASLREGANGIRGLVAFTTPTRVPRRRPFMVVTPSGCVVLSKKSV